MSSAATRGPFLVVRGIGQSPMTGKATRIPNRECAWRVEFWAKQGTVKRSLIFKCEYEIDMTLFINEHVGAIADKFMSEFSDDVEAALTIMRLEGKFADAYQLSNKKPTYGYSAFEE